MKHKIKWLFVRMLKLDRTINNLIAENNNLKRRLQMLEVGRFNNQPNDRRY